MASHLVQPFPVVTFHEPIATGDSECLVQRCRCSYVSAKSGGVLSSPSIA